MNELEQRIKDFEYFSRTCFRIRTKSGEVKRFKLNHAQRVLHNQLEQQLQETGKIRAIILKGRQMGCSTYIQARFFHKTITNPGTKTFILTHESEATKNLFDMTKRLYQNLPAGLCPVAMRDSARELLFESIDSGYAVGTAGNKATGRSQTLQLVHASECAFWPNASEHAQGIMQAVPNLDGTEVILESTSAGIGNYFHSMWTSAEQKRSDFIPIFLPWYWMSDYVRVSNEKLSGAEEELLYIYKDNGLTKEHLHWRRNKIFELSSDYDLGAELFKQEYPLSAAEAFSAANYDALIPARLVERARKENVASDSALLIGVDPAISDNDRCAIARRRGRKVEQMEVLKNYSTMELAGHVKNIIERERPHKVFIDCIGIGAGVVDRLLEMGMSCVEGVNVARSASDKIKYANLRAELWCEMRDWLASDIPIDIPDSDELQKDLCSLTYKYRSNGQLLIEAKADLKKRGLPSPDLADALALTFILGQNIQIKAPQRMQNSRYNSLFS